MLFGHQDNSSQQTVAAPVDAADPIVGVNPLAVDPETGSSLPVVPPNSVGPVDTSTQEPSILNQGPAATTDSNPIVSAPLPDPSAPFSPDPVPPAPDPIASPAFTSDAMMPTATVSPSSDVSESSSTPMTTFASDPIVTAANPLLEDPVAADTSMSSALNDVPDMLAGTDPVSTPHDDKPDADSLFSLKQQVVTQLSPLVEHLEQSPEEKFKTTMMLIQSTDNSSLLQSAYNQAQQIPDEKARAQALLDVVNEINYFTQQKPDAQ